MKRLKGILDRLIKIIRDPTMLFLPANLAFFLILSIFPILTLTGVIASFFSISINVTSLSNYIPVDVIDILTPYIQGKGFDSNVGIFMFIGFVLASNGADAIVLASNALYGIPNSNYLKRRIKDFLLIILVLLLFIFLLAFITFGNQLLTFFMAHIDNLYYHFVTKVAIYYVYYLF